MCFKIICLILFQFLVYEEVICGPPEQQYGGSNEEPFFSTQDEYESHREAPPQYVGWSHDMASPSPPGSPQLQATRPRSASPQSLPQYSPQYAPQVQQRSGSPRIQPQVHTQVHPGQDHVRHQKSGHPQAQSNPIHIQGHTVHDEEQPPQLSKSQRRKRNAYLRGYKDAQNGIPHQYHPYSQDNRSTRGGRRSDVPVDQKPRQADNRQSTAVGSNGYGDSMIDDQSGWGHMSTPTLAPTTGRQSFAVASNTNTVLSPTPMRPNSVAASNIRPGTTSPPPYRGFAETPRQAPATPSTPAFSSFDYMSSSSDSHTVQHSQPSGDSYGIEDLHALAEADLENQLPRGPVKPTPIPPAEFLASIANPNLRRTPQTPPPPPPRAETRQSYDRAGQVSSSYSSNSLGHQPQEQTDYLSTWNRPTTPPSPPPKGPAGMQQPRRSRHASRRPNSDSSLSDYSFT